MFDWKLFHDGTGSYGKVGKEKVPEVTFTMQRDTFPPAMFFFMFYFFFPYENQHIYVAVKRIDIILNVIYTLH